MKTVLFAFAMLAAGSTFATNFRCFSKYYSANNFTISISGNVVSNSEVANLQVVDQGDGFNFNLPHSQADSNYKPKKYIGYNLYLLGRNPSGTAFQSITMLLPNNLSSLNGRFDGYVSDSNADGSGSSGYFKVLCQTQ